MNNDNLDVSFGRMVQLSLKWALAAVPALVLLLFVYALAWPFVLSTLYASEHSTTNWSGGAPITVYEAEPAETQPVLPADAGSAGR